MSAELRGRIAVISPHLDDAVFSLGAAIAAATQGSAKVQIVTVFAGDAASTRAAADWDASSGFATEGEAAAARAAEDDEACRIVGAEPTRLPFRDRQYEPEHDEREIRTAVAEAVRGFDLVLLPGYPLRHEDHDWLTRMLLDARGGDLTQVALYAEQPYAAWTKTDPTSVLAADSRWETVKAGPTDQITKLRACRAYRSQIQPLGGLRVLMGVLKYEAQRGGESISRLDEMK
jgi:LmbE family N-acetylglucosaminyl deacetylase